MAEKPLKGQTRTCMVHTYLSPSEKCQVEKTAARLRLKVSTFLRRLALNTPLPSPIEFAGHQAVRDLLKVNADQARLGNMLMLELEVLGDGEPAPSLLQRIETLHDEIRANQTRIKAAALAVSAAVNAGEGGSQG